MSTTLNKMVFSASIFALLFLASGAQAGPSLGYPEGRPYYGSNNRHSGTRSFRSYAPVYSTETRQSYSYEPAAKGVNVQGGCHGHAAAPQATAKSQVKKDVAAAPQVTRRAYSYEPATPAPQRRSYRHNSGFKKELWQYQKTDPRRWQ